MTLQAIAFLNRSDELIVTTFNARGIGRPSNTGKAEVSGLELDISWTPLSALKINANATFQNARNQNTFTSFTNNQLPGEARRTAFARVNYQPGSTNYWYEWRADRDRFFDSANLLPAEDTSLHAVGFDLQYERWQVSAQIQNLTDTTVEDFNGFPKPGRQFAIPVTHAL